jgi:hypothetical protein
MVEWEDEEGKTHRRAASAEDFTSFAERGDMTSDELAKALADLRVWEAACDAVDAQHPEVAALRDAADSADARYEELDQQFIAAPAHTLDDIAVKLRFLVMLDGLQDGDDADYGDRLVFGLLRDVGRMSGQKV